MRNDRFQNSKLSLKRIVKGFTTRLDEIPHTASWYLSKQGKLNKEKIQVFYNVHKGERCFIVANGPSIRNTDLTFLNNEISLGLNRIYLNFARSSYRPTYFVSVNELVLEQFSKEIAALAMPKFINWNRRKLFNREDDSIVYLKSRLVFEDNFQSDLSLPMVFGGTVTFTALQLAYYMGFAKIIIIGLDHHYVENGTPNEVETRKEISDQSHFSTNYFPAGTKWQLPDLRRSEIDYQIARSYFEKNHREILDATIDGHCQIFKKVSFDSLF